MTTILVAYHGDPAIKTKYLARVEAHRLADEIQQAYGFWKGGKGCAVGCTLHGEAHKNYEFKLGIPEPIAWLEDSIFEGLPVELARAWPSRFLTAINPGADLSQVADRFCFWLLTSPSMRLSEMADPDGKLAIAIVADLYRRRLDGDEPTATEWTAAGDAAWIASDDASSNAAHDAVWAAANAAFRDVPCDAAGAASDAWAAARAAAWVTMATRLEDLLATAPAATVDLADETEVKP